MKDGLTGRLHAGVYHVAKNSLSCYNVDGEKRPRGRGVAVTWSLRVVLGSRECRLHCTCTDELSSCCTIKSDCLCFDTRYYYSSLTANYPSVVIVSVVVLLIGCALGSFFGAELPTFEEPGKVKG